MQRLYRKERTQLPHWCVQCLAQGQSRCLCSQTARTTSHLKADHPFLLKRTPIELAVCIQANFEDFLQTKLDTLPVSNPLSPQFEFNQGKRPKCNQDDSRPYQPLCANGPTVNQLSLQCPRLWSDAAHDLHSALELQSSGAGKQMLPRYLQQDWYPNTEKCRLG